MTDKKKKIPAMERVVINSEMYYEHDLQFYEEAPVGLLNFDDLEELVIDRLLILRMVMMIAEASYRRPSCHCRKKFIDKLRASGYRTFADLCEGTGYSDIHTERYEARRRDHLSRYTLLPCMLQSSDMEHWIKEAETHLFKWRLSALDSQGILAFKTLNKLPYFLLTDDEKKNLKHYLKRAMKHTSLFDITNFYKVPALEMLETKHIYLKNGIAYSTDFQMINAFQCQYEIRLKSQIRTWKSKQSTFVDPRLQALKNSLRTMFNLSKPTILNIGGANINELDEIAETSYAPCMRRLHEGLSKTHHLRYQGRIEYTLNLKSMGISAENALEFYRKEFTKIIDNSEFDKQYAYGFLHLYGLKGSRINYPVPNCHRMAKETPGPNEFHGCPLATSDIEDLGKTLIRWNIDVSSKSEIVNLAKNKKCTDACARYFKAIHDRSVSYPITTPMDFYRQSIKIHNNEDEEIEEQPVVPSTTNVDKFRESESSDDYESEEDSDEDCQIMEMNNVSSELNNDCEIVEINNVPIEQNTDCQIIETNNVSVGRNDCEVIEINNVSIESNNDCQIIEINNVPSESEDDCQIIETYRLPVEAKKRKAPEISTVPDNDFFHDYIFDLYATTEYPT